MSLSLRPISIQDAKAVVGKWHRHNKPPLSGLFAVAASSDGSEVVGVVIAGRPNARALQDGFTVELTRNCTDGHRNACSFLYGAARRAAVAMGYTRVYTYTLKSESGASLRAAGFVVDAVLEPRAILGHDDPVIVQRLPSSTAVYVRQANGDYAFACFQKVEWGKREGVKRR